MPRANKLQRPSTGRTGKTDTPTLPGKRHTRLGHRSTIQLQHTIGNQAVSRLLSSGVFQAESTTDQPTPGSSAPTESGDNVMVTAERGTSGGGERLPHLARIQRSFGRHDVSTVRAHSGSRAAAAARAVGARAFTTGDQVAFDGTPGLHTAAHEAAHVIQQRAGVSLKGDIGEVGDLYERHADAVADQVVSGHSAESLLNQRAPVGGSSKGLQRKVVQALKTHYGKFDTTKYKALGAAGSEYGVSIELTFEPGANVNAKKIGLTQSVRSQLAGSAVAIEPSRHKRLVPSGTGEGREIDRTASGAFGNPLYATGAPSVGDKLGDTATVAGWGQHGWHYTDAKGNPQHQKAILKDAPSLGGHAKSSEQVFETAALAVEGRQSGSYMGSVEWGWRIDGAGKFTKLALSKVSDDVPSDGFMAAAKQWNSWTTRGTIKAGASPTDVYDASYSVAFSIAKDTDVLVSNAWINADIVYNEVTVNSGKSKGKTGRIKTTDMYDVDDGTATIPLPVQRVGTITLEPGLGRLATLRAGRSRNSRTLADLPVGTRVKVMDDSQPWVQVEVDTSQPGVILNHRSESGRDIAGMVRGFVSRELIAG